jgi:hypothetical protein
LRRFAERRHAAARRRRPTAPRQHPWTALLPLRRTKLLTHPTLDQLNQLGLSGMAQAFTDAGDRDRHPDLWLGALDPRPQARPRTAVDLDLDEISAIEPSRGFGRD